MGGEYIQAANALEVGTVSEPVYADGAWTLIFCDAAFNVGAGGESVVLATMPREIYDQIVIDATEAKADQLFDEWLAGPCGRIQTSRSSPCRRDYPTT